MRLMPRNATSSPRDASSSPRDAASASGDREIFRSLLATGAVLFHRPDLAVQATTLDDKTRWLFGDAEEARLAQLARGAGSADSIGAPREPRRSFPEGGYFILGEAFGTRHEIRIVADAGPLGYLAIAAHGHADALSFTLSMAGLPMLIDPGTYTYDATAPWRRYFRGTSAHNTVTIDGLDQSLYRGGFLWHRHAQARVERLDLAGPCQTLVAAHDGYTRLPDSILHRRTWRYTAGEGRLTIFDDLVCERAHHVALHWHFAPQCRVGERERTILAERDGVRLRLIGPVSLVPRIVVGGTGPLLGWCSPSYDFRVPAPTVVFSGRIFGATRLISEIEMEIGSEYERERERSRRA
jgi:hypothetical protein